MPRPSSYDRSDDISRFSREDLDTLFDASPKTHDDLWHRIRPDEAAFIRRAMVRAQEIRVNETDPGDAYLQGIATSLSATRQSDYKNNAALLDTKRKRTPLELIISGDPGGDVSVS